MNADRKTMLVNRKRVMQRSMNLGHCICDPKNVCPCAIFTSQGICPCAGERPAAIKLSNIKLTDLVHNAGCASKIPAIDLERVLSRLPAVNDPAVISGLSSGDDAGVYRINSNTTLVQTVDMMTPCVDDPKMFGRICAANCLSDIYAMGGTPRTALSILAFPSETHDGQIMSLMLEGAMDVLKKANCTLLGGHSIKDQEIKLGFSITGTIEAEKVVAFETARVGDVLVLTKPLGVGVLNFARQIGRVQESGLRQAELSMMTLNKDAAEAMVKVGASACTDITGFGLFGHLVRMARHSKVTARIFGDCLPAFEGALELLRDGVVPGAIERNSEFVAENLVVAEGVSEEMKNLGFDAQTSGGLLISVPKHKHQTLLAALKLRGIDPVTIGEIVSGSEGRIHLVLSGSQTGASVRVTAGKAQMKIALGRHDACCCGEPGRDRA